MKPIPNDPIAAHASLIDAFCEDLMNDDRDFTRAKAVVEIRRQTRAQGEME